MKAVTAFLLLVLCTASTVSLAADDALVVWINSDKGFNGVAKVGQRYTEATGIEVRVETPDSLTTQFDRLGGTGGAPDIVIWPHDRFGSWINKGYLEPVDPSPAFRKTLAAQGWEAVRVGDRFYGYPIAIEAVSLIYNKDLIAEPPRTLAAVAELDRKLRREGKRAIEWDYNNLYFSWPFIAGAGGYSFGKHDGVYDLADVGVARDGAVRGLEAIKHLLDTGVLDRDANYGSMMEGFKNGQVAMIINGPWAWTELRETGLDIGLAPIPGLDPEHPGEPFVGVLAAAISSASLQKAEAQAFLEDYLLTYEGLSTVNADKPLGAVTHLRLIEDLRRDPAIDHTFRYAQEGELMPDFPEMKRFWMIFDGRLQEMLSGAAPIGETLTKIAGRLRRLDEIRGWTRRHYLVRAPAEAEEETL